MGEPCKIKIGRRTYDGVIICRYSWQGAIRARIGDEEIICRASELDEAAMKMKRDQETFVQNLIDALKLGPDSTVWLAQRLGRTPQAVWHAARDRPDRFTISAGRRPRDPLIIALKK